MIRRTLAALSLLTAAGIANGEEIPRPTTGYSATRSIEVSGFAMEMDVAYEDGKHRSETNMMGQSMFTIVRQDMGVVWVGMPGGMYMETRLGEEAQMPGQENRVPSLAEFEEAVEFASEGTETIEGVETTRYRYVVEDPDGGRIEGRAWLSEQNIPVQMVMSTEVDGQPAEIRMLLRNLDIGDQPDELFELPAGARKFDMGGLPGFGGGGGGFGGGIFGGGRR